MKYKESFYNIHLDEFFTDTDLKIGHNAIYNTLSGKLGNLPDTIDYDTPNETLVKNGFIVPSNTDETTHYIKCSTREILNDKPNKIVLEVATTLRCNMQCSYCFEKCSRDIDMSDNTLQDYIDYIKREIDRNNALEELYIIFFGGEPLLRIDVIERISSEIIPYCRKHNIRYKASITTNGYLYTKDVAIKLKELGINFAQISLDGFEETYNAFRNPPQNAFNTVIQNIEQSILPLCIKLNTLPNNKDEILKLATYLSENEALKKIKKQIWISRGLEYTRPVTYSFTDSEWIDYRDEACKINNNIKFELVRMGRLKPGYFPCKFVCSRDVCLSPDGFLYRCGCCLGVNQYAVGTIKDGIDENNEMNKFFVSQRLKAKCSKCILLPACNGGPCRYEEFLGIDNCEYIKKLFKQSLKYLIELNQEKKKKKRRVHSSLPLKNE